MQPNAGSSSSYGEDEPEELRRFRENWKAELQSSRNKRLPLELPQPPPPPDNIPEESPIIQLVHPHRFNSVDEILHELEALHVAPPALSPSKISQIIGLFPPIVEFEREDEMKFSPLKYIPDELLLYIIRYLDHTSIERFASISRKARVLTLDSSVWREFVVSIYKPPQITSLDDMVGVVKLYAHDYRRLYIETPRIRLDGVYVAVCRYVRPGLGESAWVNVNHLITYLRYLRFLPDGTVVSLLASDQIPPQEVIPRLDSSLRMKGLFLGNWELHGTIVYLTSLTDPSDTGLRYVFQMTLQLRSKPVGKWNKLEFMAYDSVALETGEAVPVSLKHERSPFFFSKVKSLHT